MGPCYVPPPPPRGSSFLPPQETDAALAAFPHASSMAAIDFSLGPVHILGTLFNSTVHAQILSYGAE